MQRPMLISLLLLGVLTARPVGAAEPLRHDLEVALHPDQHRLSAADTITVPLRLRSKLTFRLHQGLEPTSPTPGVQLVRGTRDDVEGPVEVFHVNIPDTLDRFVLRYNGIINQPIETIGREHARGFRTTAGAITADGVYLTGASFWYPVFADEFVAFRLQADLPPAWDAVSQGKRTHHLTAAGGTRVTWECPHPQEEIFLVAARYTEYSRQVGGTDAMAFLRTPDAELAARYLAATATYLPMYEELIGPYPYEKFALVENFWETGFGMPSFTLLGPKVIRFPFILHSSFPHEILHNWWGNSVFPNDATGNWTEGLTAYLSDHLIQEQRGTDVEYRREALQKYADYVSERRDFPLTAFRSRHSSSSEAVGYGKSLMFFHMLRVLLGDDVFTAALRDFYRSQRFRSATFDDLRVSCERVSGKRLDREFDQWTKAPGAPRLTVQDVDVRTAAKGYELSAVLTQTQPGLVYHLLVPVAVTVAEDERTVQTVVRLRTRTHQLRLQLPSRPLRLDVDPEFDVFRRLAREETPPALSQTLGAHRMLVLLPAAADPPVRDAYREFAQALSHAGPEETDIQLDTEVQRLPAEGAILVLGWENRFVTSVVTALSRYPVTLTPTSVEVGHAEIPRRNHTVVLTARNPQNRDVSVTFVASDPTAALAGLSRKLPHYHKYSYLGFEGDEPANIAKGRWPVLDSPMTVFLADRQAPLPRAEMGQLKARAPLTTLPPVFSAERMTEAVRFLASEALAGRGLGTAGVERAAAYIADQFRRAGLTPAGDAAGSFYQIWDETLRAPARTVRMQNVIGVLRGKNPDWSEHSVVVGAHYDHLGVDAPTARQQARGRIHPGADDNASGIAVLIELARVLSSGPAPERSVVFVAFTGEEAGRLGSKHYVSRFNRYPAAKSLAMLNLDTVGRLGTNKLLAIGAGSAREWGHILRGAGYLAGVDIETVTEQIDSSDQVSFQRAGVPAVQLFTGPHLDYHQPTDTADRIDAQGLVKVAAVAKEVIDHLSGRERPLTATADPGQHASDSSRAATRSVSLGTIPDFTFGGTGYRLSGVVPGSPAESCGLRAGDVVVRMNTTAIGGLRDFSDVLKSLSPGARISVTFLRAGTEMTAEAEVAER